MSNGIQLREQGWTRRFSALGRRLNEAEELYRQLGCEVLLEPADLYEEHIPGAGGCKTCIVTTLARTIYTRPRSVGTQSIVSDTLKERKNVEF